jgi:hypothetical protein
MDSYTNSELEYIQNILYKPEETKKKEKATPWCNCGSTREYNYSVFQVELNKEKRCIKCNHEVIWSIGKPRGF